MKNIKIKNPKIIVSSIAAILVIFMIGILAITKEDTGEGNNIPDSEGSQTLNKKTDYYVIMNYLKLNSLPDEYFGYFYQNETTDIAKLDNKIKLYMAIRQVISENEKYSDSTNKIEISAKEVEQEWKELFKDSEIKHESLKGNSCSYSAFTYDKKTKKYTQDPNQDNCVNRNDTIIATVKDTVIDDNKVEVYENFAYVVPSYNLETSSISYDIYKDVTKTQKLTTTQEYGISEVTDQLATYKYTFEKNNDSYYFTKVELVK